MHTLCIHPCIYLSSIYAFVRLLYIIYLSVHPPVHLSCIYAFVRLSVIFIIYLSVHPFLCHPRPYLPASPPTYASTQLFHVTEASPWPRPLTQRGLQGVTGQVTGQVDPGHWTQCGALPFMEGSPLSQKVFVSRGDGSRAGSRCHVRVCALSRPGSRRPRGWTSVAEHSHLLESWLPASTHGSQGAAGGEGATIQPVKAAHGFSPLGPFFCSMFTSSLLPCANLVPTGA